MRRARHLVRHPLLRHRSDAVSSLALGRVRMHWWRELVTSTFQGRPPVHPAAIALAAALDAGVSVSRHWFQRLIEARVRRHHRRRRRRDRTRLICGTGCGRRSARWTMRPSVRRPSSRRTLSPRPPRCSTCTAPLALPVLPAVGIVVLTAHQCARPTTAILIIDPPRRPRHRANLLDDACRSLESAGCANVHADHAASHVGRAAGLATQLRAVPFHARHRRLLLPVDVLARAGASQEALFRSLAGSPDAPGQPGPLQALGAAVFELASVAHAHLARADALHARAPPAARTVLLAAVPVAEYLRRLQDRRFDVFAPELQRRPAGLAWRLLWRFLRRRP